MANTPPTDDEPRRPRDVPAGSAHGDPAFSVVAVSPEEAAEIEAAERAFWETFGQDGPPGS